MFSTTPLPPGGHDGTAGSIDEEDMANQLEMLEMERGGENIAWYNPGDRSRARQLLTQDIEGIPPTGATRSRLSEAEWLAQVDVNTSLWRGEFAQAVNDDSNATGKPIR